jgi:HPt (histidine-containing phosphotransfer) domain-containing protein
MTDDSREARTRASLARIYATNYDKIMARVAVVEGVLQTLQSSTLSDEERRQAEGEAHKLAGVLGTFGMQEGTNLARAIEHLLMGGETLPEDEVTRLSDLTSRLRLELKPPQ